MSLKYFPYAAGDLQVIGLSSDTKPVSPMEGWTFLEEDTGKTFRAESEAWVEKTNPSYSQGSHNHNSDYEAKNANIQVHVGSAHAPSDAQKNSDITKAEIEAKLTGEIATHTHAGGSASWGGIGGTLSNQTDIQTALDAKSATSHNHTGVYEPVKGADDNFVTDAEKTNLHAPGSDNQDLSGYSLTSHNHTGTYAPVLGADDNYVTDAEKTKLANLSNTNSGDNAVNSNYSGLVSNATHTGDATGATALTVVKIQGKDFPTLAAGDDQKYPKYVSASNAFVMTAIAGGGDVTGDDTVTVAQNIVAYSGTGGKNITELTGTQGDMLYRNGTGWVKLAKGVLGQELKMNAAADAPEWSYGGVIHTSKSAGATTTGANVTPVSVTGAVFSYVANAVYRIWVMGRVNSTAATTGCSVQFDLSTAVTAIDVQTTHPLAAGVAGTLTGAYSIADDTSAGASSGVPAGPLDVPLVTNALLVTGANTGTCQLRFRSETTAVTELMAGTVMVVERLA